MVRYGTAQCSTVQYSAVQYSTVMAASGTAAAIGAPSGRRRGTANPAVLLNAARELLPLAQPQAHYGHRNVNGRRGGQ